MSDAYKPLREATSELMKSVRQLKDHHATFRTQELEAFVLGNMIGDVVTKAKSGRGSDAFDKRD